MAHDDPHSQSFNLSSNIGSTTRISILFTNDYEVWALHFEDYVLGIEEHGSTIWQLSQLKHSLTVPQGGIIRFALQSDTLRLVSSCETTKEIWDKLQELYSGDANLEQSVQTTILSEFGSFEQASEKTLTQTFNCYNHLLSRLLKYKIARMVIEQKVTFLNRLRSEWKAIVSTIKAHEEFKNYTLAKVMGILKSHEKEITSEAKTTTSLGSLALVAKGKKANDDDSESDVSDEELTREDKALMVSNPKKFFKKNFSKFKNRSRQGSFNYEKPKEEVQRKPKSEDEKKLKEQVKDEAYYAKKIADLKKDDASTTKSAFVVQEDSEYGAVEVWSTDYDDDEVRKPTHGRCLIVKEDSSEYRGYSTDGCQTSASCFTAKPVSEQVEECEAVVKKIRSIFKSLNICSSNYDKELEDLRVSLKNEESGMRIDALELELIRARDDIIYDEIDAECHKCETIFSSDDVSEAYRIRLDKIENYIQSKEHESMVKEYLSENDKEEIKNATLKKFHSLCTKLNSENTLITENVSDFDESEMSEIFVKEEVDCSGFVNNQTESKKI
ncbi:hypothetical protein L1887_35537 [Cichorium endivia]|nr:hypothetical protein L1887_35537 [Cichorium endivia]